MNQINSPNTIFCWWIKLPTSECEALERLMVFRRKATSIQWFENSRIWFQRWKYKSSICFSLLWKAQGHSRSCGRLAGWQLHSHTLLEWSDSLVESQCTATKPFLSNWLMCRTSLQKLPFSSSLITVRSRVEAAHNNQPGMTSSFTFYL